MAAITEHLAPKLTAIEGAFDRIGRFFAALRAGQAAASDIDRFQGMSAEALAREGATIIVTDLNAATAEETVELVASAGGKAPAPRSGHSTSKTVLGPIRSTMPRYSSSPGSPMR